MPLPERTGTHHGALDDARHQARCAVLLLREQRLNRVYRERAMLVEPGDERRAA